MLIVVQRDSFDGTHGLSKIFLQGRSDQYVVMQSLAREHRSIENRDMDPVVSSLEPALTNLQHASIRSPVEVACA